MKTKTSIGPLQVNTERLWTGPDAPALLPESLMEKADLSLREKLRFSVGFYDWPVAMEAAELSRLSEVASRLRKNYEGVLCIGIGGSYLGPAAIQQALRAPEEEEAFPIRWLSNVDPGAIQAAEHFVNTRKVATVVISKSGGTVETLAGFFHLSRSLDPKGYVIITDPKVGELRRLAAIEKWESFEVPPNIGGRFSVLSAVGFLPSLLGGISAKELLQGAAEAREVLQAAKPSVNPAYLFALASYLWDTQKKHPIQVLMPYSSQLQLFAHWYVQLWAESLGKKKDGVSVGPTPMAALGTSDQHSLLQLFKEGPRDKVVGFLSVAPASAPKAVAKPDFNVDAKFHYLFRHGFDEVALQASRATETSLSRSGVPTYRIEVPRVDARVLGALFFFFETACAFAGELYGVDAFDQPGVEESKKLLREALS